MISEAGQPSGRVILRDCKLVWIGDLSAEPTNLDVKYTAMGKGLYQLSLAPGGLLDEYQVSLTAEGSDMSI